MDLVERRGWHLSRINGTKTGKHNHALDVVQRLASVLYITIHYRLNDTEGDVKGTAHRGQGLLESVELIDSLDEDDKATLIKVIDPVRAKMSIFSLIALGNTAGNTL